MSPYTLAGRFHTQTQNQHNGLQVSDPVASEAICQWQCRVPRGRQAPWQVTIACGMSTPFLLRAFCVHSALHFTCVIRAWKWIWRTGLGVCIRRSCNTPANDRPCFSTAIGRPHDAAGSGAISSVKAVNCQKAPRDLRQGSTFSWLERGPCETEMTNINLPPASTRPRCLLLGSK